MEPKNEFQESMAKEYFENREQALQAGVIGTLGIYNQETLLQRTKREIYALSAQLADKNELVALLEKNPEFERIFTLMSNSPKLY
jgi:hypothetical protein